MIYFSFALNIGLLWWLMRARYRVRLLRRAWGEVISMAVFSKHNVFLERGLISFLRKQEKGLEKQGGK